MNERLAPIAIFAFKRPEHLRRCLAALADNPEARHSDMYIFCDGPQTADQVGDVERVRDVARTAKGFRSLQVKERATNQGLARSIIEGVGEVLLHHETVIVVEDDLVVADSFLAFMNAGLDMYADEPRVASIHGFVYEVAEPLPQSFFLRGADCWGWATWRRAWEHFNPDGRELLRDLDESGSRSDFDFGGAFPFREMLVNQTQGKVDSWAIRWHASTFLADMVTLYPGRSLVRNIGLEGSGTHQGVRPAMKATLGSFHPPLVRIAVQESSSARAAFAEALRDENRSPVNLISRVWQALKP